jgi:hypothetical protein
MPSPRRHRSGRSAHPPIRSLREALATAMGLADDFAYAQAMALLDRRGRTLELILFTDPQRHTPDDAIGWAGCRIFDLSTAQRLVLLSIGVTTDLSDDDVAWFVQRRARFAEVDVDLVDWIRTDGDSFRSVAYAIDPDHAWASDPPDRRAADLRLLGGG